MRFVEDVVQPLLSCNIEIDISSCDIYATLLPLFSGGSTNADHHETHHQPLQVSNQSTDQPIIDANVHNVLYEERVKNEEARNMPKWFVQTLHDRKLDALLSSRTHFGSQQTSFASNC